MASELRKIGVSEDCELAVRIDDYLLPWDTKPPVVMLHGLAESGEAFRRWVLGEVARTGVPDSGTASTSTDKLAKRRRRASAV